eukprot:jgi/Mesen1/8779/ME000524S08073
MRARICIIVHETRLSRKIAVSIVVLAGAEIVPSLSLPVAVAVTCCLCCLLLPQTTYRVASVKSRGGDPAAEKRLGPILAVARSQSDTESFFQQRSLRVRQKTDKAHLLSPEFVNYAAVAAANLSSALEGGGASGTTLARHLAGEESVSERWIALLVALHTCKSVSLYGWPLGWESSAGPFFAPPLYHSRCPLQESLEQVLQEQRRVRAMADAGLLSYGLPCTPECEGGVESCSSCLQPHIRQGQLVEAMTTWRALPAPTSCPVTPVHVQNYG